MYSKNLTPLKPLDELRKLSYAELSSTEIDRLRDEDLDRYKELLAEIDGPPVVAPVENPESGQTPAPKPGFWRNGKWYEQSVEVSYVNGVAVLK